MTEKILEYLKQKMVIEEVQQGITIIRVVGAIIPPVDKTIQEIKNYFTTTDYTPIFSEKKHKHIIQFGFLPKVPEKQDIWLNVVLFFATILTTIFAGSLNSGGNPFKNFKDIFIGIPFSFSIMAILTCHELGHYFVSRKEGMITTLPYFIPVPFHLLGTFGAVIRMKSIVPSRRSLLKVGLAGPVAGFIVALPITVIGIALSDIRIAPTGGDYLRLGDSLLFYFLTRIIHPSIPQGADLFLHPVAFAGWIGLLVTSMNLIPIGQLDGGHIAYGVLLKKQKLIYIPLFGILFGLGFLWPGWFIWGLLALLIAGRKHTIQDSITPLTKSEKLFALMPLIILILTFTPQPFSL